MAVALGLNRQAPAPDEQDLVDAVRRGDDRAFEQLYSRYRPRIGAFVQRMVSDHGRAEDIAQEVFIAALRRLRATDQPVIFKPWLYEIAKNACIDEFRRARRAQEVSLYGGEEREDVYSMRSLSPSPDAAIESKQRLDDLRGAFRGLSESHHRILVLRELEGLSYNQISDRMGMSKPVVESTLFRARRRLGEEFQELESGRRCARVQDMIAAADARPVQSLGLRERRLLSRHLSHCGSCLRQARLAGIDDVARRTPSKVAKIAAAVFAPIPWLRFRRGDAAERVVSGGGHAVSATRALESVAPFVGSPGSLSGVGRAATAAAIAIAGAGGGLVAGKVVSLPAPAKPAGIIGAHGTSVPGASGGTASGGGLSSQQSVARALGLTGIGSVSGGVTSGSSGNSASSSRQSVPQSLGGSPAAARGAIPALGAAVAGAVGSVSGASAAAGGPPAASAAPASGGSAGAPASSPPASGDGSAAGPAVNASGGAVNGTGAVNTAGGAAVNTPGGPVNGAGNAGGGAVNTVTGVAANTTTSAVNDVGAAVPASPPPTTTTTATNTSTTSTTTTSTTTTSTTTTPTTTTTTPGTPTAAGGTPTGPVNDTPAGKGGASAVHRAHPGTRTASTVPGAGADAPQPAGP